MPFAAVSDQHGELERLLIVETRIDLRAVSALEIRIGQTTRPTGALGHILAGQLDVHAAEVGTELGMDAKRQVHFLEDVFEPAGLETPGTGLRVAVHGITAPENGMAGAPHRLDHPR